MNETSILVVEDEPSIREVVTLYLKRAGYQVTSAEDGTTAMRLLREELPDLVVLDLMLPGVDGYEITQWLRAQSEIPIIMLTARREVTDRIAGLEMGADDYIVKPFSPQEIVSRVRAVLRRTQGGQIQQTESPLEFGDLRIDPDTRIVEVDGHEKQLTAKEFDLLWMLARHPRHVFNRDQLLDGVWGLSDFIDPSTVTVHVRRIREKIESDPSNPRHLITVWGVGYRFEP
jgi:DNA-binding response OmpR family regulator